MAALAGPPQEHPAEQPGGGGFGRHILLFGVVGGVAVAVLQAIRFRWLVYAYSVEIYATLVAVLFATVGIWLGRRLTRPQERVVERVVERVRDVVREVAVEVPIEVVRPASSAPGPWQRNEAQVEALGLTPRELDMLTLVVAGLTNREIAERAFVSENTVKTHLSRVFEKLGVQRRAQVALRARELGLVE